ncbi:MAG: beta strand repeat-containing protein, partial [Isosphaeraceae bacterium]
MATRPRPSGWAGRDRARYRRKPELVQLEDRQLLSTITVTNLTDTVTNNVPASGTLRWAVEQADADGGTNTINFASSLFTSGAQTITLSQLGSPVEMTTGSPNITIDGPGANLLTIQVAPLDGVALVVDSGVTATITGLTVTGASLSATNGGAISDNGSLSLSNCTITANTISGVYVKGTATISDCTITGNNSYSGAGVYVKGGTATITDSTLSDNSGAQGGGVCDTGGTVTMTDCTLSGDSTLGGGGALYNSGQLKVYGCTLTGDDGSGAAVYNNKGGTTYLSGTTISGASGFIDGGGLSNENGGTLTLTGCTITGNTAQIGAGLYNAGSATLTNCTISNNDATFGYGGGISNGHLQNKAVLVVNDCTITGNTCIHNGGGVGNWGTATLTDCTIADNFANQGTSILNSNGGGVNNDGTVTLVACTISGNSTTALGGGLYNGGLGVNEATLNNTIIAGNTTTANNGGPSDIAISGNNGVDVSGSYDIVGIGGTGGIVNNGSGDVILTSLAGLGLTALGNYGGTTETMALLPGSPAIHAGSKTLEVNAQGQALTTDQRGEPLDTPTPDIGAFQSQGFTLTAVADSTPQSGATGAAFAEPLGVTLKANNPIEPVAGGIVSFAVNAASDGAAATLSASSATVGSNGVAEVTATANEIAGAYTVSASVVGVTTPVTFDLTNLLALTFTVTPSQSVTYGTPSVTLGGTLANGAQAPTGEDVSVTLDGITQKAAVGTSGAFSTTFDTALPISGSPYKVTYAYTSDGTYASTSTSSTLTVTQATPVVSVSDAGGPYDASPYTATATVAGLNGTPGPSLEGVTPTFDYYSGTYTSTSQLTGLVGATVAPSATGAYTVMATFPGSTDYTTASALANFTIAQATPTLTVTDAGGTYDGSQFPATATVGGLNVPPGPSLEGVTPLLAYYTGTYTSTSQLTGLTPTSTAPSAAGAYTVRARFAGSTDYTSALVLANFTIAPATPTVTVADTGGTYDGSAFPATDTVAGLSGGPGTSLEGIAPTLAYYNGTYTSASQLTGLTSSSSAPSEAGAYTVLASFAGSTDYAAALALADFSIGQIAPALSVSDTGGAYNGNGFSATATVTGLGGTSGSSLDGVTPTLAYYTGTYTSTSQLSGLTASSTAPDAVGDYTVLASFASADYTAASALANFTITQATPSMTITQAGGTYDGSPLPATASLTGVGGSPASNLDGGTPTCAYYSGTSTSA